MQFEMMAAYTRRDLSNYYRINAQIHSAINAAAKNPVLTATYNQVNARLQALRFRSNQDGEKWKRAMKEHEKMIDALQARDSAAMRELLVAHLRNKCDVGHRASCAAACRRRPPREPRDERAAAAEGGARTPGAGLRNGRPRAATKWPACWPGGWPPKRTARCCSPPPTAAAMPPTRRSTR